MSDKVIIASTSPETSASADRSGPPRDVIAAIMADQDAIARSRYHVASMCGTDGPWHYAIEYTEVGPGTLALVRRHVLETEHAGYGIFDGHTLAVERTLASSATSEWRIRRAGSETWEVCAAPDPRFRPAMHLPDKEHGWSWSTDLVCRDFPDPVYRVGGRVVDLPAVRAALASYRASL